MTLIGPNRSPLLAPVRSARKTAGKTTAVTAGLVVSRHKDYIVGDAGAVSVKSTYRKHAACHCQPEHRARPVLRLQEHQQWCARTRVLRNTAHSGRNLETFVEYLPRPRQLGSSPDPPGGRAAPRIPPARAADNIVGDNAAVLTRRGHPAVHLSR
jgi:hypothetical protein